jgi:8-oxo-dGTP pyrophosphatase MutT (NUDIX family)
MTKHRIIKRKLKYEGRSFSVYRYTAEVGGRKFKRDIIERAHGVVVVPIDEALTVLMIREYCAGSDSFILSLPGGSVEGKAAPEEEAARELREETGYAAKRLIKLHFAFTHPSTSNRRSHTFLGYGLNWEPLPSSNEIIDVVKIPLDEAIERSYEDFRSDVSTIGNLLMARDKLAEMGILPSRY